MTENTISEFLEYLKNRSILFTTVNESKEEEQLRATNYFNFIFSYGFLTIGIIDIILLLSPMVYIQSIFAFSAISSIFLFIVTSLLNKNQQKKYSNIQLLKNSKLFSQVNLLTEPNVLELVTLSTGNIKFDKQILLEHFLFWNSDYEKNNNIFIQNYAMIAKTNKDVFENSRKKCYESLINLENKNNKDNNKKERSEENITKASENDEEISSLLPEKDKMDEFIDLIISN